MLKISDNVNCIGLFKPGRLILGFWIPFTVLVFGLAGCGDDPFSPTDSAASPEITFQLRTAHFDFYAGGYDVVVLPEIALTLERNFDRITSDLRCAEMPRVHVFIYPSLDDFHDGVDEPLDEDWFAGYCGSPDTIHMVSPYNPGPVHTYVSIMQGLVHEFVHAVFWQIRGGDRTDVPLWLFEGVACYEAGPPPDSAFIKDAVLNRFVPSLVDLERDFFGHDGYQFSYTVIEYAVHEFGMEAVVDLILAPNDLEAIFGEGITLERFESGWRQFLEEHYAG